MLPHIDPFTINPPDTPDPRQKAILTTYWLYQVIISWVFSILGFPGIIIIRFLLAGVVIFNICRNFKLSNTTGLSICILSAILFLKEYTLDRSQTISFVSFFIRLLMLFRFIFLQPVAPSALPLEGPGVLHGGSLTSALPAACPLDHRSPHLQLPARSSSKTAPTPGSRKNILLS